MTQENEQPLNKDKQIAQQMYMACLIAFALTLMPSFMMGAIMGVLLIVLLIAAYVIRAQAPDEGLLNHHMRYIIRTTWIGGFYAFITTIIASIYMTPRIDYSPFEPCANSIVGSGIDPTTASTAEMSAMAQPCMDAFMQVNGGVFAMSAAIAGVPVVAFFLYRFVKGLMAVKADKEVVKILSWF